MTSTEKVAAALDRVEEIAEHPDATPAVKIAAALLMMARPNVEQLIPTDPAELDDLLGQGARWLLGLRSDDARELTTADVTG